jgi:hypothetical protein
MPLPIRSIRGLKNIAKCAPESFDSISMRPLAFLSRILQVCLKLLEIGVEVIQLGLNPLVEFIEPRLSLAVVF